MSPNRSPLTLPIPATIPSAGVFFDQVLERAAPPLRRDHQRAVLDEGAGIAQVLDVLARGALTGLAPARDRLGPRRIESDRVALHAPRPGRGGYDRDRLLFVSALATISTSASSMKASGCPSKTASRSATVICRTMPLVARWMTCSIFIASITKSCWPGAPRSPSRTSIETIVPCIGALTATVPSGAVISMRLQRCARRNWSPRLVDWPLLSALP